MPWRMMLKQTLGLDTPRRRTCLLVAVALTALMVSALVAYSVVELTRFARAEVRRSTLVYAAGQPLTSGIHTRLVDLAGTLGRLGYRETRTRPAEPGQFRRTATAWDLVLRGQEGAGVTRGSRLHLEIRDDRLVRITRDGRDVVAARLEGEVLAGGGDRGEDFRPLRLNEAPRALVNALLAAEDHRFYEHGPFDLRGLARAAWANLRAGRVIQGGSTLTQQLVKSRLLTPRRTVLRKVQEAWLSVLVEWRYSKTEILEAYLNEIYLGQRGPLAIRGVGAAARAYFGKEAHQLTTGEAALLAGMVRAPNTHSPVLNPARAQERRDAILARMQELDTLSGAEYERARREPVRARTWAASGLPAPYFADYVRQELEAQFEDPTARTPAGARIFTTLDPVLQRFAEPAVARGLDRLETGLPRLRRSDGGAPLQAALIALDPATGEIRALVGGA